MMSTFPERPGFSSQRAAPRRIISFHILNGIRIALLVVSAAGVLAACSLDYGASQIADKLNADVPDLVLYNFEHTSVRHDRKSFEISADVSRSYNQKKEQVLDGVGFREFNEKGEVITRGSADHALLHTDTDNVELTGNIHFYSKQEGATVTCNSLFWNDKERTLKSLPEDVVSIHKDSGTQLSGTGFSADVGRNEVRFTGPVSGTVVAQDEARPQ